MKSKLRKLIMTMKIGQFHTLEIKLHLPFVLRKVSNPRGLSSQGSLCFSNDPHCACYGPNFEVSNLVTFLRGQSVRVLMQMVNNYPFLHLP
ncbi:hypothetical protein L2E82_02804 [Cichorium intybus]|uniref:Uncharacterized protein n=1 Tax=Cichorium intybus TaxID=13427 RepID=A0ACB9H4A3_CICIN|nr:hypothetical protein L2E82_02804 [Cichorium intybus]